MNNINNSRKSISEFRKKKEKYINKNVKPTPKENDMQAKSSKARTPLKSS